MRKSSILLTSLFTALVLVTFSCNREEMNNEPMPYDGPLLEADTVRTLYSDSAVVRVMVEASKQLEFENGDREFPNGFYFEFYETDGATSSTLEANYGYYYREDGRYTAIGDVVVQSVEDNNMLLTDTLHWKPDEEKVYTRSRVTIIEEGDTLRGTGLEAAQDFSTYTILKPEGTTLLDDEE